MTHPLNMFYKKIADLSDGLGSTRCAVGVGCNDNVHATEGLIAALSGEVVISNVANLFCCNVAKACCLEKEQPHIALIDSVTTSIETLHANAALWIFIDFNGVLA